MAEQATYGYGTNESGVPQLGALASLTTWTGAVLSLTLVVGLCVWGYKIAIRDVSEVPVIKALEGPYRIQPEDPGGETAAYQGLAVNKVQAEGSVEKPAESVVLAPDPVNLEDEDSAPSSRSVQDRIAELGSEPKKMTDLSASLDGEDESPLADQDVGDAVAEAILTAEADARRAQIARMPGVKRSPRPKPRLLVAALTGRTMTDAMPEAVVTDIEVDPASIEPGTKMAQLGAYDDRDTAVREWDNIVAHHGDLIGARKRLIQEAESGGRSFYRLRLVGFDDATETRRLCSALLARGAPCIPVTAR